MADDTRRDRAVRFERLKDVVPRPLPAGSVPGSDRRNMAVRTGLALRVQHEYEEMPGLALTAEQARRLFALRPDVCERVLGELVASGVLRRAGRRYVLQRTVA